METQPESRPPSGYCPQQPTPQRADANLAPADVTHDDDWKPLEPKDVLAELRSDSSQADRMKAQAALDDAVKKSHKELMERWKSELDTLLVYAGLFSAILTAFNVESYRLLTPDTTETAVAVLTRMSEQLHNLALPPEQRTAQNARRIRTLRDDTFYNPPHFVVWVNCLWFSSLIISLASASIALLIKQWLYENNADISGKSRASAQLRQYRMDSLRRWHVGRMIMLVPILLQLALIVFLIGLAILLWNLHSVVATVSTSFTGVLFLFLVAVTVLPAYRWDCCYRAPQALLIYTIVRIIRNRVTDVLQHCIKLCAAHTASKSVPSRIWWSTLQKVCGLLSRTPRYRTSQAQEQLNVRTQARALDVETAITAYEKTLDPDCLDQMSVALAGVQDMPLVRCLSALDLAGGDGSTLTLEILRRSAPSGVLPRVALTALRQTLTVERYRRGPDWEPTVHALFNLYNATTPENFVPHDDLTLRTAFLIAMEAKSTDNRYTALCVLAAAVNVDSVTPPSYSTVSHVLSATEQWIEKQEYWNKAQVSASEGALGSANMPQTNLSAFQIVVHCMLCVVERKTAVPAPQRPRFESLCTRARDALSALPGFLPPATALVNDSALCDQLSYGLQLLLAPLVRLSREMDASELVDAHALIHGDVVNALESVWGTASAVLDYAPVREGEEKAGRDVTERLSALQREVDHLFNPLGLMMFFPR